MPLSNALLIRAAYGWDEATRASSITLYGRRENLYGLGSYSSPADVARVASGRLDVIAVPRYQYDADHRPVADAELAYHGYGVGDTLPITTDAGTVGERVISIAVSEDTDSGRATVTPSLHDVVMYASPLENYVAMIGQAVKKMIPGTGRGDWKEAQPVTPPAIPAPLVAWEPQANCAAESFNQADSPSSLGPDLTWVQASSYGRDVHGTQYSGLPYAFPAGTKSSRAGLYQPNFPAASGKDWGQANFSALADQEVTVDQIVTATIPSLGTVGSGAFAQQGWYLYSRCEDDGTNWVNHIPTGWQFEVTDGYFALYCNSVASNSELLIDDSSPPAINAGSVITLQATGTMAGGDTRIIATIDGTTVFDLDHTAITAALTATSIDPATELPEDGRGGFGFYAASYQPPGPGDAQSWATNGLDGLTQLDDFSVCPA